MTLSHDLSHVRFHGVASNRRQPRHRRAPNIPVTRQVADEPLDLFIAWVLTRSGLDATAYRTQPLHRRLPACLRQLKVATTDAAQTLIERKPELMRVALSSLLIGVTEFFREPLVFARLQDYIAQTTITQSGPLRVWSASCSTGVELYSMAILLAEVGLLKRSTLLGTDCRLDAIEEARRSLYEVPQLQASDQERWRTFFEPVKNRWRPLAAIRHHVEWKQADILKGVEPGPWHIILWRNAAIYLNPQRADTVWRELADLLSPSGILVTGKAERPPRDLGLVSLGRCLYAKGPRLDAEADAVRCSTPNLIAKRHSPFPNSLR